MSVFGERDAVPGQTQDLATLAQLDDSILLAHLRARYDDDTIYVSLALSHAIHLPVVCVLANRCSRYSPLPIDICGRHPCGHQSVQAAANLLAQG